MIWIFASVVVFALAALADCGGGDTAPPPPSFSTIEPHEYLVQSRACDGNVGNPLHVTDPITCRRFDIGHHQSTENFALADGSVITTWGYAPFGPWVPPHDGGERYVVEGPMARIASTEDGGTPNQTQYFVGPGCGGTGWLSFRNDVMNAPTQTVARLAISRGNPFACSASSQAFTQWWTASVDYPRLGPLPSIVSEHYNSGDRNRASALERFFFGKGWGRLVWQAWRTSPPAGIHCPNWSCLPADLAQRCPAFAGSTSPGPGWRLVDCRVSTIVEPADGTLTGAQLWHPR